MPYLSIVVKKCYYWWRLLSVFLVGGISTIDHRKIQGFQFHEVFGEWTANKFPNEYLIVLTEIDVSKKGIQFWMSMPKGILKEFVYSGVVVLRCKDLTEAFNLATRIPNDFAAASVYVNGSHVLSNGGEV